MRLGHTVCLFLASATSIFAWSPQLKSKSITWSQRSVDFPFGRTPVRGVNIGGWLLLEPWITPSIFETVDPDLSLGIVDEFTLTGTIGTEAAMKILRPHWDTWCTFQDFQKIANAGFNTVRIPVGYWAYRLYDNETYTQGSAVYIDAAIDWARAVGLKIWIDLHGAPLSQNGYDNSGHKKLVPGWQTGDSVAQTLEVLEIITLKYAQPSYQDVVVGIELLNEPAGYLPAINRTILQQFYQDGYDQVRNVSDTTVIFHDAFSNANTWNGFLNGTGKNVLIDHHEYQVFTYPQITFSNAEHRQYVCNNSVNYNGSDKWVVVGEWSGALTDCAKYLNGYGVGVRYDGTYPNATSNSTYVGSCANKNDIKLWDAQLRKDVRWYIEAQLDAFEKVADGWLFWNFKTENSSAGEWDAFALLDAGLFPQPLTDRKYPNNCTYH